ncbi:unnamed protein product [Sympodiomycopsis kandeliae]
MCPSCSSPTATPIQVTSYSSLICSECGCILSEEVELTHKYDFASETLPYNSGGSVNEYGITDGMLTTFKNMRSSHDGDGMRKQLNEMKHLTQMKYWLGVLLQKVTGHGISNHPLHARIFNTFKELKAKCSDTARWDEVQQLLSTRNRVGRLTWGIQSQAAMCACVYSIFRSEDLSSSDAAQHKCYSLGTIAHLAQVPRPRVKRWFRVVKLIMSLQFAHIKMDAPVYYIDQIIDALPSVSNFTAGQRKIITSLNLQEDLRPLARRIAHQILQSEPFATEHLYRSQSSLSHGEWAYHAVVWAMNGILGQTLKGNLWIRSELIDACLSSGDGGGSQERGSSSDSHIAAYHSIGQAIAERAQLVPWLNTSHVKTARRTKRQPTAPGSGLKHDQIAKHVRTVIDFGIPSDQDKQPEYPSTSQHTELRLISDAMIPPPPPPPSWTSTHHAQFSKSPALLDTLPDETVDSLLFTSDELSSYLRTPSEISLIRAVREKEWNEYDAEQEVKRRSRKRVRESEEKVEKGGVVLRHGKVKRTKADQRLMKFTTGNTSGGGDEHRWSEWSSDEEGEDDGEDEDDLVDDQHQEE